MKLLPAPIAGVFTVNIESATDERGFFARTWDPEAAKVHGLREYFDYTCVSGNTAAHTLRGMHYQMPPHGEEKLIRCTSGRIFDVAVDLRPDSPTFKKWFGLELSAENHTALYIPAGCAHGFLTLEPHSEVLYHLAGDWVREAAAGVRWDDPAFGIAWPAQPAVIAERDATYPDFEA